MSGIRAAHDVVAAARLERFQREQARAVVTEAKGAAIGSPDWFALVGGWGMMSKAGQEVSLRTALEVPAVLACARVIANGLAQVPCKLFRVDMRGRRVEARNHPLFRVLYRRPNILQTSFEFRQMLGFHLVLTGNAFCLKVRNARGQVVELLPFDPQRVVVTRHDDYTMDYQFQTVNGRVIRPPREDVWHLRGPSWTGYSGLDSLALARNAVGLALATEAYGSELFANGARPQGILTTEQALGADSMEKIRQAWQEQNAGAGNRFRTAVVTAGLKWQAISATAEDSQFIETKKMVIEDVARAMGVDPVMIGASMDKASYASVEQRHLAHRTNCLGPWFEAFEQSAEVNLLSERDAADGLEVELLSNGLAMATAKDMAETLAIYRGHGAITGNEMRAGLDLPPEDDAALDSFVPAANLYGNPAPARQGD